jgi:HD-GYP domain-containing protein (c-di-GMP phosphodiesterase class II)
MSLILLTEESAPRWSEAGFPGIAAASADTGQALFAALDPDTARHSTRVSGLTLSFASWLDLSGDDRQTLTATAHLHDLGKIGISGATLHKPGSLTRGERAVIRRHPLLGRKFAAALRLGARAETLVLHHHERWDGRGYPHGLAAGEIPFLCQVLSLADCYDALVYDRAYRRALSPAEALTEIRAAAGTQFNPELAREFIDMVSSGGRSLPAGSLKWGGGGWPAI